MRAYVRAIRHAQVDDRGLLIGDQHRDVITFVWEGGEITTHEGLTVATETEREAAPVILPGRYAGAYWPAAGGHKGRDALCHWGKTPLRFNRGGVVDSDHVGLNIHDWRGRSDGCITVPQWWIDAVFPIANELPERAIDLVLEEAA